MIDSAGSDAQRKARDLLANSPVAALRGLRVDRDNDTLYIQGRVGSFYHKQLAQETVRRVAGGLQMINSVSVDS